MTSEDRSNVTVGRKVGITVFCLALIALFATALNWQLQRALDGNRLSWAYVVEWPVFIGYTIYFWWKDIHGERPGMPSARRRTKRSFAGEGDGEISVQSAAYNKYLAELQEWEQRQSGGRNFPNSML